MAMETEAYEGLQKAARDHLWMHFTRMSGYDEAEVPIIVRGEGCRVWDDSGRAYLDFGGGIAVVALGHRHPAVTAAAHAQLDELWHASNLYWTEPMLRLAGLLAERWPSRLVAIRPQEATADA